MVYFLEELDCLSLNAISPYHMNLDTYLLLKIPHSQMYAIFVSQAVPCGD